MDEIKTQLEWLKAELTRVEQQFKKELARVDGVVVDLRQEVHDLVIQVRRGNAINIETQGGLLELRRECQTGFDGVHDSLVSILEHLRKANADVP